MQEQGKYPSRRDGGGRGGTGKGGEENFAPGWKIFGSSVFNEDQHSLEICENIKTLPITRKKSKWYGLNWIQQLRQN